MVFFLNLQIQLSEFLKRIKAKKRNFRHQKEAIALFNSFPEGKTDKNSDKQLLIIRVDDIGDYVLFRNFLSLIKSVDKYKDYHITLLGNIVWKELAISLDSTVVDHFLWLDKGKFFNDDNFKVSFLNILRTNVYDEVWVPTYTPSLVLENFLAYSCVAKSKIGWDTKDTFPIMIYTSLVKYSGKDLFMFNRNKLFFELVLSITINLSLPRITIPIDESRIGHNYVVIFPGSNAKRKCWAAINYAKVANHCIQKYGYTVIIAGSHSETKVAKKIMSMIDNPLLIMDLTGKTNLSELAKLIKSAQLLISNDTSGAHIGASLDTNTIVVLNGNNYGRFFPYPPECHWVRAVYTNSFNHKLAKAKQEMFAWSGKTHIDEIRPSVVIEHINEFLK